MMLRAVPLMLLASTWAQEPEPRIATTKTTSQGGSTVCSLYTPEISVPVGGKVHVRLYGELPRTQENYTYTYVYIYKQVQPIAISEVCALLAQWRVTRDLLPLLPSFSIAQETVSTNFYLHV